MGVSGISEFRKNLFQKVEQALQGETVEFVYKGRHIRLVADTPPSRLQRLPKRKLINGTVDDLESASAALSEEVQKEWDEEWKDLH